MNPETEHTKAIEQKACEIPEHESGYYEAYANHAKILRNWLVAFGIGVPFLFATNVEFGEALRESNNVWLVISLFFFGRFLQLL